MSNNQFTALHQTALSPACHLPLNPADPADDDYPRYLLLKTVIDGLTQTADKLSAA